MIICRKCGRRNADGEEFCAGCRAFLEYDGERVPDESSPEPPPSPEPAAPEPPRSIVERLKDAVSGEPAPASAGAAPPAGAAPGAAPATPAPAPAPTAANAPIVASTRPSAGEPAQPASRRPGAPDPIAPPRRFADRVPERPRPRPGELVCGECGWGNDPARNFCRHCGSSLRGAEVVHTPWYRRLVPRRRPLTAGERPRRLRRRLTGGTGLPGSLLKATRNLLVVAVVVAIAAFALSPPLRSAVERRVAPTVSDLRKLIFPHDSQVHPIRAVATGEVPRHGAAMAIDSFANTYWAADLSAGARPS